MNITIPQYLHSSGSQIINCNCSDSLFASLTDLLFSIGTASVFDSEAVLMENNTSAKEAIIAEAVFTIHYLAASAIVPDQSVHHCGIAGYIFRPSSKNVCVCVGGGWGGGGDVIWTFDRNWYSDGNKCPSKSETVEWVYVVHRQFRLQNEMWAEILYS